MNFIEFRKRNYTAAVMDIRRISVLYFSLASLHIHCKTTCKDGFVKLKEWCFSFHLDPVSRAKALEICGQKGGKMVKLDSVRKEEIIIRYLEDKGYYKSRRNKMLMPESLKRMEDAKVAAEEFCVKYKEYQKRKLTHHQLHIPNREIPLDSRPEDRANNTTPLGFSIKLSSIPGGGLGAWAEVTVLKYTVIGSYEGEEHRDDKKDGSYAWVVKNPDSGNRSYNIDAFSPERSNWLRYINTPRNAQEENLHAVMCAGLIFYMTTKTVLPGTELMVWYGNSYGLELNITRIHPDWDLDFEKNFYMRMESLHINEKNVVSFDDNTPVEDPNWTADQKEIEVGEEFGLLLAFDGSNWTWAVERNYSFFIGNEDISLPFMCEQRP